jgi:Zn-dependent M28 family amino/carboxypeptidase
VIPDLQNLRQHVEYLTCLNRHYLNIDDLHTAAVYIHEQWKAIGLSVDDQPFEADGNTFRNVITALGPKDAGRIIVGAHYDVCITDAPAPHMPGADDNASGVAGLLELGRLLKKTEDSLKHRIELVAYANEEPPYFQTPYMGSAVHVRALKAQKVKVLAMLSLEMLGYFTDEPGSQMLPYPFLKLFYPTTGNFIAVASDMKAFRLVEKIKNGLRRHADIEAHALAAPRFVTGVDYSDHLNYLNAGWPAVMITDTAFYRNPHYHQPTDTLDTLDFKKMAQVIQGVYGLLLNF